MREQPDPEHPGQMKAILEKYDYQLPHLEDQVTGHTSPAMLKKYIKASNLKVVEKLTDKYDYFR